MILSALYVEIAKSPTFPFVRFWSYSDAEEITYRRAGIYRSA